VKRLENKRFAKPGESVALARAVYGTEAVAAVYSSLRDAIVIEIDMQADDNDVSWRRLVLRAYQETNPGDPGDDWDLPDPSSTDVGEWELLVDVMADRILWDRDWELEDLMVDSHPAKAAALKMQLGIDDDYFTDIPPDPHDADLDKVRRRLNSLTGSNH